MSLNRETNKNKTKIKFRCILANNFIQLTISFTMSNNDTALSHSFFFINQINKYDFI